MQLFSGMSDLFIEKALTNEIATTLEQNFRRYLGYSPGKSEVHSWLISLKDLAISIDRANLPDSGIVVEYRLPLNSKRLDAMILGKGRDARQRGVIIELKQWEKAYKCGVEDCVTLSPNDLRSIHPHPSRQAGSYAEYLKPVHTAFYSDSGEDFVDLKACSFLHNANSRSCGDLYDAEYQTTLGQYPLFTGDNRELMEELLSVEVGGGDGELVLGKVLASRYAPSKKLLEHVAEIIQGNPVYTLLDEQLVTFNLVLSKIRHMELHSGKAVILVVGAPGTGKSVIAVRLIAALASEHRNVVHVTGSKAFTTNLRAQVGRRASNLFTYSHSFTETEPNTIDVLVMDEAHRIREHTTMRYKRTSTKEQVLELIDAAKVSVFLLDENQVVRPGEVGSPAMIREAALKRGTDFWETELKGQYRLAGSESYMTWLDHAFDLGGAQDLSWRGDYEFVICDTPQDLQARLNEKFDQGLRARLVAGFCWHWSAPRRDNTLVDDVVIGAWHKPWNRKATSDSIPPSRHPYTIWATKDEGFKEVGCIYSIQGFEFDYCGVIFGKDLIWNPITNRWEANRDASFDSVVKRSRDLSRHLSDTYRVLMTRGMKGTYVYFLDDSTRQHFEQLGAG